MVGRVRGKPVFFIMKCTADACGCGRMTRIRKSLCLCKYILIETVDIVPPNKLMHKAGFKDDIRVESALIVWIDL